MSQESVMLDGQQTNNYGQDLTQLLDDLFFGGYHQVIPNESSIQNIVKTIPLDNEYGHKYAKEIYEFYETNQAETAEFSKLEDFLARVYYKHELGTQLIHSSGSTEEEMVAEDTFGEETSEFDPDDVDTGSVVPLVPYDLANEECPEDIFCMDSPIFTRKSDLRSIPTTPTDQERALLEKYAVLFAEPLLKKDYSGINFPSNRPVNAGRLTASGNEGKKTIKIVKSSCNQEEKRLSPTKQKCVFQPIPSEIIFTDCKPGKVYQTTLELRNMTYSAQQCSVIPPQSGFFLISEGQYPTENKNFVAPGLSCRYTIKFRPKLFTVYEDRIQVNVSHGQPFEVKLLGKRRDPILEMKHNWNCGECFCGNEVKMEYSIKNSGGSGDFWLYQGDLESQEVQKLFSSTNSLSTYNDSWINLKYFTISPTTFALRPKGEKTFTLTFKPLSAGYFCEHMSILCDNLTCIGKFVIIGRSVSLNRHLVSLKCRWNFVRPQETWDVFAEHFLNFETVYAGNEESLSFTMINNSSLFFKYHWDKFYPLFNPKKKTRVAIKEPTLNIFPSNGELVGHKEQTVKLTYKPDKEGSLHVIVQLVVENIPKAALDKTVANIEVFTQDRSTVNVLLNFVDVQGKCLEYNLAISPPQLLIHGALELGTSHRQLIQLINHKRVPAYFKWSRCSYPNIIEVAPVVGFIGATYEMTLEVKITGTKIGEFTDTLYCEVQGVKQLLELPVVYRICGHKVLIENGNVNLGLIRAGCYVEGCLLLRNTVPVNVPWRVWDSTIQPCCNQAEIIKLKLDPTFGEIGPLASQKISVVCHPRNPICIRSTLQLEADGAIQGCVAVIGEVIIPNVCLQACTYFAGTVYRSVPFPAIITLINNSAVDTSFCWDEAEGVDAKSCTINFEPIKGSIAAFESKTVCVTCTVNQMISFHDVCVPCWVDGMTEPIYWSVSGEVNGIEIFCSLDNDSRRYCATLKEGGCEVEPHFDISFGAQVPIGSTVVREFRLTNNSAIKASFKITGDNFIATKLDEWQKAIDSNSPLPDYSNKKMQETLENFLNVTKSGLAFIVYPPMGSISAFKTTNIQIIGLSDMWGFYTDMITVQVAKVKPIHMKVCFNSVGMTLKYLAAPRNNDSAYKLRFGNHLTSGKKQSRGVKVINIGPCDLTIDFKSYGKIRNITKDTKPLVVTLQLHKHHAFACADLQRCDRCKKSNLKPILPDSLPRAKLVELDLHPYYGEINDEVFYLSPNPLFIRARSEATLNVDFTPPNEKSTNISWKSGFPIIWSHCVGTVTLDRDLLLIQNKVSRQHGRKVSNMDFNISASLTIPKLTFIDDDDDDEKLLFRLNSGDFLFGKPEKICKKKTISFRNDCAAPLHAVFSTFTPFSVTAWPKIANPALCGKPGKRTPPIPVEPGNIIQLGLEFTLKRCEVDKICRTSPCHKSKPKTCPLDCFCNFCKDDQPHQLFFEKPLKVQILENSKEETFSLIGNIILPYLILASPEIDFGICLVGQTVCQGVGILNLSICDSSFCVVYENNCNEFRVEPIQGHVPGCHLKSLPGRTELEVFFTPKDDVAYIQTLTIHGAFTVDPLRVVFKGVGSYDFNYKRDYDVVDST